MESIHTTAWSNRANNSITPLIDRQGMADSRERSARAYRGTARVGREPDAAQISKAPVSLELSGSAHMVEAFVNFADAPANERVRVRLVDAVTTRTVGELMVGQTKDNRMSVDDYGHLRFKWGTIDSPR